MAIKSQSCEEVDQDLSKQSLTLTFVDNTIIFLLKTQIVNDDGTGFENKQVNRC